MIDALQNGSYVSRADATASDRFLRVVSLVSMPVAIATLVALLIWVYRARKGLEAFRAGPFAFSPGLAVGSFFIPLANFWLPLPVLREIWKGSDPVLPPFSPAPFKDRPSSPLVGLWWAAFLSSNLAALAADIAAMRTTTDLTLSMLRFSANVHIVASVLLLAYLVLTAVFTREVTRRQDALAGQVHAPPLWLPQPVTTPWGAASQYPAVPWGASQAAAAPWSVVDPPPGWSGAPPATPPR